MTEPHTPSLIDTRDAAGMLSVSERTLRNWMKNGTVPGFLTVKVGGARRFKRQTLLKWIESGCQRVRRAG